jgi:ADP-ribose pyrophosphatase YjhB (NUDIX family)
MTVQRSQRNPAPTVDIIIELARGGSPGPVVLVRRRNPPPGWALPGGFVDYGESAEQAARREAAEETGLEVELVAVVGVYSDPERDPRGHTLTTAFAARAWGDPAGGDDAAEARAFSLEGLPRPLCFDHGLILEHYRQWRQGRRPGAPVQRLGGMRQ